jgi:hypothetical protein
LNEFSFKSPLFVSCSIFYPLSFSPRGEIKEILKLLLPRGKACPALVRIGLGIFIDNKECLV